MADPAVELVVQRCQALLGSLTDSQQRQAVNALAIQRVEQRIIQRLQASSLARSTGGTATDPAPFGGDAGCRGTATRPLPSDEAGLDVPPGIQL